MAETHRCPMCFATSRDDDVLICCGHVTIHEDNWQANRAEWLKEREHELSQLPESERRQIQERAFRNGREV